MHLWTFLHTIEIDTVVGILKAEPTNSRPRYEEEDDVRRQMLIATCLEAKAQDKIAEAEIDLSQPPYDDAYDEVGRDALTLKLACEEFRKEADRWTIGKDYVIEAADFQSFDLLREALTDMASLNERLPERLVAPTATLLKVQPCYL